MKKGRRGYLKIRGQIINQQYIKNGRHKKHRYKAKAKFRRKVGRLRFIRNYNFLLHITKTKRNSLLSLTDEYCFCFMKSSLGLNGIKGTKKRSYIIHYENSYNFANNMKEKGIKQNIIFHYKGQKRYRKALIKGFLDNKIKPKGPIINKSIVTFNGTKTFKKR